MSDTFQYKGRIYCIPDNFDGTHHDTGSSCMHLRFNEQHFCEQIARCNKSDGREEYSCFRCLAEWDNREACKAYRRVRRLKEIHNERHR